MEILKDKLCNIYGGNILDIATGRGEFIQIIKNNIKDYKKIIGIDESEEAIKLAKKEINDDNIEFIKMNAESLDFSDESFNVVCLSNSLHHMQNHKKVFSEIKRVLKPDGVIVINEMMCDNQNESQLSHVYLHHLVADIDTILGFVHNYTYTKKEIIHIINELDLNIIETLEYNEFEYHNEKETKEDEEENINSLIDICNKQLERVENHEGYDELVKRADEVKNRLKNNRIQSATQLVILAKC